MISPLNLVIIAVLLAGLVVVILMWRMESRKHQIARRYNQYLSRQMQNCLEMESRRAALEGLIQETYNALLLVDGSHVVRHMNAAARELFGKRDFDGDDPVSTVMQITRHHEMDSLISETLARGEVLEQQIELHGCAYRIKLNRIETLEDYYVTVVMEDISEIQRLGRARREMVANISHELRTPITSIRLLLDTLQREKHNKATRKMLKKIGAQADTLNQLVQELMDLSMIESGRMAIILREVELNALINDVLEDLSAMFARKELELLSEIPPDVMVLADADQVKRVLTNLLHNAIKFTPDEGAIAVRVMPNQDWVKVCVMDSGPGIIPEDRSRVFERFYRSDPSRQGSGTGLGLAIAKHIVKAHGGRIWVSGDPPGFERSSEQDGKRRLSGAHICFTLPTADY